MSRRTNWPTAVPHDSAASSPIALLLLFAHLSSLPRSRPRRTCTAYLDEASAGANHTASCAWSPEGRPGTGPRHGFSGVLALVLVAGQAGHAASVSLLPFPPFAATPSRRKRIRNVAATSDNDASSLQMRMLVSVGQRAAFPRPLDHRHLYRISSKLLTTAHVVPWALSFDMILRTDDCRPNPPPLHASQPRPSTRRRLDLSKACSFGNVRGVQKIRGDHHSANGATGQVFFKAPGCCLLSAHACQDSGGSLRRGIDCRTRTNSVGRRPRSPARRRERVSAFFAGLHLSLQGPLWRPLFRWPACCAAA